MDSSKRTVVVGAGVFGVTAALALRRRGHSVTLLDPGPLPHPLAASTDISKAIRIDYGPDLETMALAEEALDGWRRWNASWSDPLFRETGVLFITRTPMAEGGFEYESHRLLLSRGHKPERLDAGAVARRYPAFAPGAYVDGYFNPEGGYAESGRVVARLIDQARESGVALLEGTTFARLLDEGSRVSGVQTSDGGRVLASTVVAAAGAWTPHLLPWTAGFLRSVGMPVFHLAPDAPDLFRPVRLPVFCADISATGWYGFPIGRDTCVKVANHGPGREMHPESPARDVTAEETAQMRAFVGASLPALAEAPIVSTRVCLYCDTRDEQFWIARDPEREGLVVATGDSGHAFKFAPVLGDLIADAAEGLPNPRLARYRWRPEIRPPRGEEAARRHE